MLVEIVKVPPMIADVVPEALPVMPTVTIGDNQIVVCPKGPTQVVAVTGGGLMDMRSQSLYVTVGYSGGGVK